MVRRYTTILVRYYYMVPDKTIGFNDIIVDEYGVVHTVKTYTAEPAHEELFEKEFKWEADARHFADKVKGEVIAYHFVEGGEIGRAHV